MARYIVKRPFPAKMPMRAGQIVEDPQWKDLTYLISRNYIAEVDGGSLRGGPKTPPAEEAQEVVNAPVEDIDDHESAKPLSKMNKAELAAHAVSIGVNVVPDSMTNKEIIAAIEEAE